jgi:hypothetical protein
MDTTTSSWPATLTTATTHFPHTLTRTLFLHGTRPLHGAALSKRKRHGTHCVFLTPKHTRIKTSECARRPADGNNLQPKMSSQQRLALEAALLDNCTATATDVNSITTANTVANTTASTRTTGAGERARRTEARSGHSTQPTFHVDPNHDASMATASQAGASSSSHITVRTVAEAVVLARASAPAGAAKRIVLSPGVHFLGLNGTMELGSADSGLTIASSPDGQVRGAVCPAAQHSTAQCTPAFCTAQHTTPALCTPRYTLALCTAQHPTHLHITPHTCSIQPRISLRNSHSSCFILCCCNQPELQVQSEKNACVAVNESAPWHPTALHLTWSCRFDSCSQSTCHLISCVAVFQLASRPLHSHSPCT